MADKRVITEVVVKAENVWAFTTASNKPNIGMPYWLDGANVTTFHWIKPDSNATELMKLIKEERVWIREKDHEEWLKRAKERSKPTT